MTVTVDGDPSEALGVMSQGELMALALSLFVPRVSSDETPFGFVLIDDPVQSMDPIRVDQLAVVLGDLAKKRQVIVFTHDDRLTTAVRQRKILADVHRVTRRAKSRVEISAQSDPASTAIDDAKALLLDEHVPAEVARRVIPGLCRQALEASCRDSAWRRMLKNDKSLLECEAAWAQANTLKAKLALALRDDDNSHVDVTQELVSRFGIQPASLVDRCNQLTHAGAGDKLDLENFISDTRTLSEQLKALP